MDQAKENKLGVMPVNKLLITMAVPVIISMLVQALYNIVDSIFVARLSEDALTAVSMAFPMQQLLSAIAVGTGVGTASMVSRSLGQKNPEKANVLAAQGVFLALASSLFFILLGVFFSRYFMEAQTDVKSIIDQGTDYLFVCMTFSSGMLMQVIFERMMQATGITIYTMISHTLGAVINIVLDPILIFGMFGFPMLGVKGAAIATVTGQWIGALIVIIFNHYKNKHLTLKLKNLKPQWDYIKEIYAIGIPSMILIAIGSIMVFCMNKILAAFTETAVAVFGAYFKLQSIAAQPVFGINSSLVPIVSYNFGAKKPNRILKAYKCAILYASISVICFGAIPFISFPKFILGFFNASQDMIAIGVPALRICGIAIILAGYCIVTNSVLQALGKGFFSSAISFIRQLVVLIPVAYLLSLLGDINLVWWCYPIAEIASATACTLFFIRVYRKLIKPLYNADPTKI